MDVIQNEVSIFAVPNKCGSQPRQTKDLITQFEYAQQDGISNKQKKMVENRNQHQILLWAFDHLWFQILHQEYTE